MKEGKGGGKSYLIDVVPIARNAGPGTLSYFSLHAPRVGQIVRVQIRKKRLEAVVLGVRNASLAKTDIKQSSFALKKISKNDFLDTEISPHFLEAARDTERFFASSLGAVLSTLIPRISLDHPEMIGPLSKRPRKRHPLIKEPLVIQLDREERLGQYRSIIRQSFARKSSVLIITPGVFEAEKVFDSLSKGIETFAFLLTPSAKKSEAKKKWLEAKNLKHPVLVVTTGYGSVFERSDIGTIILERENSRAYRTFSRPFINLKYFLSRLARHSGREFYLGDSVLSLESLWLEREGGYGEFTPVKWRLSSVETELVNMKVRKKSDDEEEERPFEVISPELESLVSKALSEKAGIFLFGARKGLAPSTICGDCGSILPCLACGAPVVLHKREENFYLCHRCGAKRDPKTVCDVCQSWKLNPLGIGTELIAREAKKKFPSTKIHILDKEHVPSATVADKLIREYERDGGILVGTEQVFYHLSKTAYTAIVSIDSLFSLPDFGAEERIFYLVSRLREISEKKLLIQTRNIGKEVLAWAAQGNILDFYKKEIGDRKDLSYPPFSIFIKIESDYIRSIKEKFAKWQPEILKKTLIMRLPREDWPDDELIQELSLLPPNFSIKVDPESLI